MLYCLKYKKKGRKVKNNQEEFYPAALTIAASDSGGGSGIQADLRTFNAAGVYGCSVITAVNAQNPRQITASCAVDEKLVKAQMENVFSAIAVKAVKTGMLANAKIVKTVAEVLKKHKLPLIVDPMMFSASGAKLADDETISTIAKELLPLASLIILNLPEAEYLTGRKLKNDKDYTDCAMLLADTFHCNILLKTTHSALPGKVCDTVVLDKKLYYLAAPVLDDMEEYTDHGCGCTLSSGITAMIAAGNNFRNALTAAAAHVFGALSETAHIGKNLDAMYPPLDDYSSAITLRSLEKNSERKGTRHDR